MKYYINDVNRQCQYKFQCNSILNGKNIQDLQKSTNSKISGLIQTVREAKNVETISTSEVEGKKIYLLASEEPSLEELKSETSISSMSESKVCLSSCLLEKEANGSFSVTDSSLTMSPCLSENSQQNFTLTTQTSERSPGRNIQLIEGNQTAGLAVPLVGASYASACL